MSFIQIQENENIFINRNGQVKSIGPKIYIRKDQFDNKILIVIENGKQRTFSLPKLMVKYFFNQGKEYNHAKVKVEYRDGNKDNLNVLNIRLNERKRNKIKGEQEDYYRLGEIQ